MAAALELRDVTVRFGGLVAVDAISLVVGGGQKVGLIGPNGAGKTTTFNACTGLLRPNQGSVALFGKDATAQPPVKRAETGLGRTFQRMELYDSLTVYDNVALGCEARLASRRLLGSVLSSRRENREIKEAAERSIAACGLEGLRNRRAGALSSGQRRLVEFARAAAGGFRLLLLDEPSSGLDQGETGRFADTINAVADEQGLSILLVEHDMSLVRAVCDYVYVLDFGQLIHEGLVNEALDSDVVRSAYLGLEPV